MFHPGLGQSAEAAHKRNPAPKDEQPDQQTKKRPAQTPEQPDQSGTLLFRAFEKQSPHKPNEKKDHRADAATEGESGEKSGGLPGTPEGHGCQPSGGQTDQGGKNEGGQMNPGPHHPGPPAAPHFPNEKKDRREKKHSLPEWRTVRHRSYRGRQSCAR